MVRPSPDRYRVEILGFTVLNIRKGHSFSTVYIHCKAIDKYEEYRFYGEGIIATQTGLATTILHYGRGGLWGGRSFVCLMTDCDQMVRVGMEVGYHSETVYPGWSDDLLLENLLHQDKGRRKMAESRIKVAVIGI